MQVSRLHLVDMAGAERLLVDPELLRQREGSQVNQSLLTFATTLRKLAQGNPSHSVNQDASVLTKLLSGIHTLPMQLLQHAQLHTIGATTCRQCTGSPVIWWVLTPSLIHH